MLYWNFERKAFYGKYSNAAFNLFAEFKRIYFFINIFVQIDLVELN